MRRKPSPDPVGTANARVQQRSAGRTSQVLLLALTVSALVGCSKPEDKVFEALKCAKVATLLGQRADVEAVTAKAGKLLEQMPGLPGSPSRFMMQIGQQVREDLALEGQTLESQIKILTQVHQSGTCQDWYR